ncbi:MAG: hypothetical protein M1831_005038 [Alyxoria varia]|nr:MAG: hypothetical protein M1831_005038 [Alyxoria varia]
MALFSRSPFTATTLQVATYLLGVALFSISFLVFLNSSVSFVVTTLIGQKTGYGDAVGTLGFADEVVALVACPVWGILSDRIGVKNVAVFGYAIVGLSLFVFVQARNVYPELLLARLLFSVGGAATSTMVTATLPTMTTDTSTSDSSDPRREYDDAESTRRSSSTEATATPGLEEHRDEALRHGSKTAPKSRTSQIAGIVGMFTGLGALIALGLFLPLPAKFEKAGHAPGQAIKESFYVVGSIAFAVALSCALGLRNLKSEEHKGWKNFLQPRGAVDSNESSTQSKPASSYLHLAAEAIALGFKDVAIGLGYLGGFVARASSVANSLFIPLYVNDYFISSGLCRGDSPDQPAEIKDQCRKAYEIAAMLTGVSQLIALISAPIFGYLDGKQTKSNLPLITAALAGIIGYVLLGRLPNPDVPGGGGSPVIFLLMALLGISQIGAIVCSLSLLGRGIQESNPSSKKEPRRWRTSRDGSNGGNEIPEETSALLRDDEEHEGITFAKSDKTHLKGSIAGIYSLAGGAGILLLTKLGGLLFDRLSPGAPFYMLAIFNAILLVVALACGVGQTLRDRERLVS